MYRQHRLNLNSISTVKLSSLKSNQSNNSSIIDELDLFEDQTNQQRYVEKIQSFLYASIQKQSIPDDVENKYRLSSRKDFNTDNLSPKKNYLPSQRQYSKRNNLEDINPNQISKDLYLKKSVRDEIFQQNQLLQRKFKNKSIFKNHNPDKRQLQLQKQIDQQVNVSKPARKGIQMIEDKINNSKVLKLYNFIKKQLPKCNQCSRVSVNFKKQMRTINILCQNCSKAQDFHPILGVMYDIENKIKYQDQAKIYETLLTKTEHQIEQLQKQLNSLKELKQNVISIKNITKKINKQIVQCKYYLKKNIQNFKSQTIQDFKNLLPKQYFDQLKSFKLIETLLQQKFKNQFRDILTIIPIYLLTQHQSKVNQNIHELLNYQKQQQIKISVSQDIKMPIKSMELATFIIDGSYNLPVFENIKRLKLEFHNKKTFRELNDLFLKFPRQIQALQFQFNYKIHSHISAESFPFFKYISPIVSLKKISLKLQSVKEFKDFIAIYQSMTPKDEFKVILSKHVYCKQDLILPSNFYHKLLERLGPNLLKFHLQIPQSFNSQAYFNMKSLLQLPMLVDFYLNRGDFEQKRVLNHIDIGQSKQKKIAQKIKRLMLERVRLVKIIKTGFSIKNQNKDSFVQSILNILF